MVFQSIFDFAYGIFERIGEAIKSPFIAALDAVKSVLNSIVQGIAGGINSAISMINRVIEGLTGFQASTFHEMIPNVEIPEFAEGGMVTGPTLGLVGEAGPEYIVPARKAQAFAQNILAGVRGPGAIPRFAEGGFVAPSSANVSIQTGPVTQMDGQNFVTTADLGAAVEAGVLQTLDIINRDLMARGSCNCVMANYAVVLLFSRVLRGQGHCSQWF